MLNTKLLASLLIVLAVLFSQVGFVAAAPQMKDPTPVTGTVQGITVETDSTGVTTVLVTLVDDQGATQTVLLSLETATMLGLVSVDPITQLPVANETQIGHLVEIDPATVILETQEKVHPIAALLASFFGQEASVVSAYHEDGFGFGVIAQALWIAQGLAGDASMAGLILEAKESGDYSAFVLPDGSTPTNWGQFKKAALGKDKKSLGVIVSGHAENEGTDTGMGQPGHGKGKGQDKEKGNGKGKDKKNRP